MTICSEPRDQGFTLLELLVALVVFGFILVGLSQGVHFGLQAWDRQARGIDARSDLDAVDRTLRTLLSGLDPTTPIAGRAHAIAFTSDLPEMAEVPDRDADLLLLVDARHRLVLRWIQHRHAQRLGPVPTPRDEVLLDGIQQLDLAYWAHSGATGWLNAWQGNEPPAMIRIRLVFPPGDPRHWPDIVAPVMRDRPGG